MPKDPVPVDPPVDPDGRLDYMAKEADRVVLNSMHDVHGQVNVQAGQIGQINVHHASPLGQVRRVWSRQSRMWILVGSGLLSTGLAALTWWLLSKDSQGAGIANVLMLPLVGIATAAMLLHVWNQLSPSLLSKDEPGQQVEVAARSLAARVRELSLEKERHWRIGDPRPLMVKWRTATDDLLDHWENIHGTTEISSHRKLALTGEFPSIHSVYRTIPSGRLVIVGRAGAGKTVLAHRLILEALNDPVETERVPVLFSFGNWDPSHTSLPDWLVKQLIRDFSFLNDVDASGTKLARVLQNTSRILPVLDGFDEIQEQYHDEAISEISRFDGPLILTTRPREYAIASRATKALSKAAAIELDDLPVDEAYRYLKTSGGKVRAAQWEAVFSQLHYKSDESGSHNLADVLATPLMVMLARTTYNDSAYSSPTELLDSSRFSSPEAIEKHLLNSYLTTVYDPRRVTSDTTNKQSTWDPDNAQRWLRYLANHLTQLNTHDLAWWQLGTTLHRHTRILATTVTVGLPYGFAVGLAAGLTAGLITGLVAGFMAGLLNQLRFRRGGLGWEPQRLHLSLRRRKAANRIQPKKFLSAFSAGLAAGIIVGPLAGPLDGVTGKLVAGMAAAISIGIAVVLIVRLIVGLIVVLVNLLVTVLVAVFLAGLAPVFEAGLAAMLVVGIVVGVLNMVLLTLGDAHDPREPVGPWDLLATDCTVTLTRAIVIGLAAGLMTGIEAGPLAGIAVGIAGVIIRLLLSAWGSWVLAGHLILPAVGRLSWRPRRFLEDAYNRGVLRQSGAVYQFRHAMLRDHLANQHRANSHSVPPRPQRVIPAE